MVFACPESGVALNSGAKSIEGLVGGISPSDSHVSVSLRLLFVDFLGCLWDPPCFVGWLLCASAVFELLSSNFDLSVVFKPANSCFDCLDSCSSSCFRRNSSRLNDFPPNDMSLSSSTTIRGNVTTTFLSQLSIFLNHDYANNKYFEHLLNTYSLFYE